MDYIQTNKVYIIKNVKSGTVVDLSLGDNATVAGYALHSGPNQKVRVHYFVDMFSG